MLVNENSEPKVRILVIDDEIGMREGCRRALVPLGYQVNSATDMTSAWELIRYEHYDLVLLDVMMPDGSGIDLIGPIHKQDPDTICIVITGYATVDLAVDSIKRGAYDFLSKPFTSDQLIASVNQGLERRHLSLEAKRLNAIEVRAKELSRAKEELEQLDKIKSQFMLTVTHELRAPVTAMQSHLNLILAGYVTEDEMETTLARLQRRLQDLSDLIADLLELAQLKQITELNATRTGPQPMADILEEVCDLVRARIRQKNQELEIQILDRPTIIAQKDHMKQIWMNLISNAIKYTPEGGQITVSLQVSDNQLIGKVEDSGIGIDEKDLPNLFQEFFRTEQARASCEPGTGLGLAIVQQIVDFYRGEIQVVSRLGKGSCFTFILPL